MFVDASALVAVVNQEPGWEELVKRFSDVQNDCVVSPLARFEAVLGVARAAAMTGAGDHRTTAEIIFAAGEIIDELLTELGAEEISVTPDIGRRAVDVAATYGRAVGHPADLNFGDCFAYACAKSRKVGLIYKGDDFARTDLA